MSNKRRIGPKKKVFIGSDNVMDTLAALGAKPKAQPRSGRCMSCGEPLKPTEDHSVCDKCWPPDIDPSWKQPDPHGGPDFVELDLDTGTLRELDHDPREGQ